VHGRVFWTLFIVFAALGLALGLRASTCCAPEAGPTVASHGTGPVPTASERPPLWAVPVERTGLPNLHRVSDGLYRGAQPTAEGFRALKEMGVRTVVNLRSFHSDRDEVRDAGLAYAHITMKAWHPEDKEVVRFLRIATDPARTPVFVHCQHGADRTGVMCAIYRVAVQGWPADEAVDEMSEGGFGHHRIWANLRRYVRELDLEQIKRRAGLAEQDAGSGPEVRVPTRSDMSSPEFALLLTPTAGRGDSLSHRERVRVRETETSEDFSDSSRRTKWRSR